MRSTSWRVLSWMLAAVGGTVCGTSLGGCGGEPTGTGADAAKGQGTALSAMVAALGGEFEARTGSARLTQIDESGVEARIEFVDDGAVLTITGEATGLDPFETYVTLIYDNGSLPGGPNACAPTIFNPADPGFILSTMLTGFWEVDEEGNGTLFAINTNFGADYVPLDRFRNTSVRLVTGPPPGPGAPPMTELVACGRVASQPRR